MTNQTKTWQKPSLLAHKTGLMNKVGAVAQHHFISEVDGHPVEDLMKAYGSPLFVLSEQGIRDNVRQLRRAFETRFPRVIYAWSYKTNYLNAVCSTMHQEGAWAEVVSAFEYEKARALGVPADRILFNGPHKKRSILERVVEEGGRIHIDHLDELYLLEDVAAKAEKKISVTIRINFDTGYTQAWSRFGFNLESGQAMDAARRIGQSAFLELRGIHSHIGTFILDPRAYAAQARIMCGFMEAVEEQTGCKIESVDLGGGFASKNTLHGTYLPPEQVVPSIDQYAEAICDVMMECKNNREARGLPFPTLILESGRAMVDDAGTLLSSVVGTKRLPDGKRSIVIDAGVNILFTAFWYNHAVHLTSAVEGIPEETVVYGPLCMNIDVVRASMMLPPMSVGDVLHISPVGAYNNTQWMQFIEYRPAVVMTHPDGSVSVIREAEDLACVVAQEKLPAHLAEF
ncbi:MAG: alanine racemase [Mariprofundaceae bacterium]|nr:alanine racemase [Mariprofundaceae bacterium]